MRIIILFLLISNSVLSQTKEESKFLVSIGTNPFIHSPKFITDLNHEIQGEEVVFSKSNQLSSEFYLIGNFQLTKKWGIGFGFSYIQTNYNFSNYIETSEWQSNIPQDSYLARLGNSVGFSNKLKANYLGIKFQSSHIINKTNSLKIGLDFQKLSKGKFKNDLSGTRGDENIEIREESGEFFKSGGIIFVPEIFMQTQLYKNLNLTYGAKMRFWNNKTKNFYELSYQHYDYTVIDYKISTRNFGFFIGFNYQFPFKKKD